MTHRISRREFLGTSVAAGLLSRCAFHPCPPTVVPSPLPGCEPGHRFENWAETISCRPSSFCQPQTIPELADVVTKAADAGKNVRVTGAGHSWSPFVLTNDVLVNLDRMHGVDIDPGRKQARVGAGIRLRDMILALRGARLGMANLGSITEQSIAGAANTGTHGTGLPFKIIASQIVKMKVVSGKGEVVTIDGGDLLRAARVSFGTLGVIAEVTLQCVDDYTLDYAAYWCRFDDIVDKLDLLVKENQRLRLWWLVWSMGCLENVIVTTMNPPGWPAGWLGQFAHRERPSTSSLPMDTKTLLKMPARKEPACSRFAFHEKRPYNEVLNVPLLRVLHRECEYSIPVARAASALRQMKALFEARDWRFLMPVEVRFVGEDDSFLSPAQGRNSCYIGVSTRVKEYPTEVFAAFEPIMKSHGGRPHWGKLFNLTRAEVKDLYPDYEHFREIKLEMDPRGVFANEAVRQVFG